jgi:hypothetical protein
MKIRKGFVSNSSSSSFCIYGTSVDSLSEITGVSVQEINEKRKQKFLEGYGKQHPELVPQSDEEWQEYFDEDCDYADYVSGTGLEIYSKDGYEYYIGKSWHLIGDDETGKEFKAAVEAKVKTLIPKAKCETYFEEYYC